MATINDFLRQGVRQVRKSIKDIDDSYNNDWDILAELTQNAVDAIRQSEKRDGIISIKIDSQNKAISIYDNGVGIDPERLPELLAPFATDKEDDEKSIGEKGVGLTFVIFSCNDFSIKSGSKKGVSEGTVIDAHSWKNSLDERQLPLVHTVLEDSFVGTEVTLKKVYDSSIFQLSFNQLGFVLRTRTALGNTNSLWEKDINIKINLIHINQDGQENVEEIPFKYFLPIESIDKFGKIDVNDFYEYIKADRTDQDKRKKLKDKIVYKTTTFNHSGRTIKAFACFVPKRKTWDDLSIHNNIATSEQLLNNDWLDKFSYATLNYGIFTSVKGMPTGITVDTPSTGTQGAWPQIFILFEDRYIKFDIGRKSLHGMQSRIFKMYAREIFNEFQRLSKYISGDVIVDREWDKEETFAEIEKLLDLNIKGIHLQKSPREQEASVAGLFFECLGNGKITDIKPLVSGYRNRYDLYAKWGNKKVVIEFKSRLANVLNDFRDEAKLFNELNCIVCWNVTENDQQILSDKGIDLEEVHQSSLPGSAASTFPNATHKLSLSGFVAPVYVIDLKLIIGA